MAVIGLSSDMGLIPPTSPFVSQAIYRGRVGGDYVYSVGSAPLGATDVIIVGYT